MGLARPQEGPGELGPAVRGAHVDRPDDLNARPWRLDPEQAGRFPGFDAAPELFLGREKEVLIERVGRDGDLDPLAPTPGGPSCARLSKRSVANRESRHPPPAKRPGGG